MSLVKFELTEKHIAIAKIIDWQTLINYSNTGEVVENNVFGGTDFYEDVALAIYGKVGEFDPTSSDGPQFTKKQKAEMDKLWEEMPMALQIMMQTGTFEVGNYKTKHYDINWKKKK